MGCSDLGRAVLAALAFAAACLGTGLALRVVAEVLLIGLAG